MSPALEIGVLLCRAVAHGEGVDEVLEPLGELTLGRPVALGCLDQRGNVLPVHDAVASLICAQLLFLESENPTKDIAFYINSPGGVVTSGLAIYDTMQYIRSPVSTVCIGQAASMGSLLLCAGAKGKRFSLPNSRIMIHQPSGGAQGQATDIEIQAREILALRARLNEIYVKHTGQALETIVAAVERDKFLSPLEAKEFGIVDEVVDIRPGQEESQRGFK